MSVELRDRFFALSSGQAADGEVARYRAEVDATDSEPAATLDGLGISWHPTSRHKAVRFIEAERIDADVRELFARPSEGAPHLAAVFVDPRELSFRTFENIVPLDRLFADVPLELGLTEPDELGKGAYASSVQLPDAARAGLERLDSLDLYVPPLNASSRGGERFIFHSALLAEALTRAVAAGLPEAMLDGFSHVNPVFRCNRFEPGDSNFHHHRDTPYYDAARGHVSRYTVLLYLTGGSAEPALDLTGGPAVTDIEPFTCVIFDQRYEHEGAPYRDGRKVFLRTELVFSQPEVTHDPDIGAQFSKACYWTGESVFAPELARHADAYYNQVAAAHWSGLVPGAAREPFVHKQFRGVHFLANGYDFWFPKSEALSLAECAAITLLDYFNCKLGDAAFHDLCDSEVIEAEGADSSWIPAFLDARRGESAVPPFDKSGLFPEPEETDDVCCPFHDGGRFDPTRLDEIVDLYERTQTFAKAHIMPAPILMLGEDVVLDPEKFVIRGNQIHVLGKQPLTPVNFAACWNSGGTPDNYIDVAATVGAAHFLVPPILFTESDDCYHLQFDFFRNTWMVNHQQSTVPVPMIRQVSEADIEEFDEGFDEDEAYPWMDAVDPSLVVGGSGKRTAKLWWADDSPLVDELYDFLTERDDYGDHDDYEDDKDEDKEEEEG
ncbi:hypothetical protein FCH28_07830 [Streptomyces piniterrae]|uniref:2OG-Fe(II) oxygenase n=1 Tax=Streptomyces piniterrae TaxID=2571125 RepID=A0A4V5MLJ1_9ACTN|nr:hypothetical protein [Streptomyces piniterrae]TJZ57328.1 hypothetical protein FCH28_07830 [Streptomyces piniterrae]